MGRNREVHASLAGVLALVLCGASAKADAVADFYRDRTVTVVVPAGMGGSIGLYAQLFSNHFGRHIPGAPNVILQSRPGSGGVTAAAYVYNAAPRDGTVVAQLLSPSILAPVLRKAKFDATRFQWLGTISPRASVISVWHKAPATTLEALKETEVIFAAGGRTSSPAIIPMMMNKMLGTKIKVVTGYKGGGTMNKAVEQGEAHGRYNFWTGWTTRKPEWIRDGKIITLAQIGPRIPELPDVPSLRDLVKSEEHRQMLDFMSLAEKVGLAFWVAPQVPTERYLALRSAFAATMADPAFLAEAKKKNAPVEPVSGEEVARIVKDGYRVSPDVLHRLKVMIGFAK